MKEILLIGGGGHCKSVIDVIEQQNIYKIAGIIDEEEFLGNEVLGYKVIGSDIDLPALRKKFSYALITIGHVKTNKTRVKLYNFLKELDYTLPIIVSPHAYVSKHSAVDEGTIVMHHALINSNAKVGKNCIINSKALIEHDAVIEDNVHISTAAVINGGSTIKENTFFGSGAIIKEYSSTKGFIRAGSVVK